MVFINSKRDTKTLFSNTFSLSHRRGPPELLFHVHKGLLKDSYMGLYEFNIIPLESVVFKAFYKFETVHIESL